MPPGVTSKEDNGPDWEGRDLQTKPVKGWTALRTLGPSGTCMTSQRSEGNSHISAFPGHRGHDFELLIKPSITHNQISSWRTRQPQHSVPPSPFGGLNQAEERRGETAGVRLEPKHSTCGSHAPWNAVLPLHGAHATTTNACQQLGNGEQQCWRGQGSG